jgi:hypothetical protein
LSKPFLRNRHGKRLGASRHPLAAPIVTAAAIAIAKFAQSTQSQKDTRTIGFATAAVS